MVYVLPFIFCFLPLIVLIISLYTTTVKKITNVSFSITSSLAFAIPIFKNTYVISVP